MKPLMPEEIRRAVRGKWLHRGREEKIVGVTIDSRHAAAGNLFVAILGGRHDGHDHLAEAAAAGCLAAIVRANAEIPASVLKRFKRGVVGVTDTTAALGDLAAFYRTHVPAAVIAVTGSNGKTTVKRMIHHVLSQRLSGSCGPKSFNNAIGVPLTLFRAGQGHDYVVCEMGTNHPGEIGALSRIARPDVAVITCIGPSHLEGLTDLPHIAVEKAAILGYLEPHGLAIVNADSKDLDRALSGHDCNIVRFGLSNTASLRLTGYTGRGRGQRFQLNDYLTVDLPVPGRHNALNAIAAIGVAQRFGIEQPDAAAALKTFKGMKMRLEFTKVGRSTLINDAYNANPASVLAAADVLADCKGKRRVMMVGDMLELGDQAESLHVEVGKQLAGKRIDLLIGVGPLGRYIAQGAAETGENARAFESLKELQAAVGDLLQARDTVLIKGSRGTGLERLAAPVESVLGGFAAGKPARRTPGKARKRPKARRKGPSRTKDSSR